MLALCCVTSKLCQVGHLLKRVSSIVFWAEGLSHSQKRMVLIHVRAKASDERFVNNAAGVHCSLHNFVSAVGLRPNLPRGLVLSLNRAIDKSVRSSGKISSVQICRPLQLPATV